MLIGDFARLGQVSVRMLRHYDSIGLLKPELILTDGCGLSNPMVVSGHAVVMGRFDNLTNKQANEYFAYSITVGLILGMMLGLLLDQVGLGIVVGFAAGTGVGLWFLSKRVPNGPGDVDGA